MRWIREHKLIAGLLALLMVLVIIFVVSIAVGGSNPLTSVINDGTSGVSGFLSSLGNGIREQVTGIFSHNQMQDRIDELEEENARLERELAAARLEESWNSLKSFLSCSTMIILNRILTSSLQM